MHGQQNIKTYEEVMFEGTNWQAFTKRASHNGEQSIGLTSQEG